jgi:predicted metal-dependent hydrolase
MAVKKVEIPQLGTVKLYKHRGARSIRLSVTTAGDIRVSLPYWLPFEAGAKFAISQEAWIHSQLKQQTIPLLEHGQAIGKSHHLYFATDPRASRVATRVDGTAVRVTHASTIPAYDESVQRAAEAACVRALRSQAESLLPQRLSALSLDHDLSYRSANIKRLKGRWGSCDTNKNIVLNLFLMQLPWQLIDYVLVHELTHTRVLHHGADFWQEFEGHLPNAKSLRREIRAYRPVVKGNDQLTILKT